MSENLFSKPCRPGILSRFFALLSRIMYWGCCAYLALLALFLPTFFLKPMLLNHDTWSEKTKTMLEKKCRLEIPESLEWHDFSWRHSFRDEHISGEFTSTFAELERLFPPERFLWQKVRSTNGDFIDTEQHLPFTPNWDPNCGEARFVIYGHEKAFQLSAVAVVPASESTAILENTPEPIPPQCRIRVWFDIL